VVGRLQDQRESLYMALRYCLIRVDYTDSGNGMAGTYTVYVAVEEVGRLLADPDYLPEGAEVLRQWLLRDR